MKKKAPNLVIPVSPMYDLIMADEANALVGKFVKITQDFDCAMESQFGMGMDNDNLELSTLHKGDFGFVVGSAQYKTTLRVLFSNIGENASGEKISRVYHVPLSKVQEYTEKDAEKDLKKCS